MANLTPGDVGIELQMSEAQPIQALNRVMAVLEQLGQTATRIGNKADEALNHIGNTSKAVQGIHQLMQAQKEEADAAAKAAAEQAKHREELAKKQKALQDMRQGLTQVATAATAMAVAIGLMAKTTTDAFKQQQSAFLGLEAVANRTTGNFTKAKEAAESLASDGLMSVVEVSKAVQAGLASGFNLEETVNVIKAFKDSAAFNRQAGLEYGESIVRAMEGIRMSNSVLSDAAGITKNLSQILKEAGFAEQDLMRVSSDASVRRALYNGLLKESAIFQGNAAKAAETLAGAESRTATAAFNAKAAIGEALAPALQSAHDAMRPLIGSLTNWADQNPELARGLFLVIGGMVAFTAAITAATVAAIAFNAALGPIGWAIVGISAAIGAFGGYAASVAVAGQEAQRTQGKLSDLVREYEALKTVVDDETRSTEEHNTAAEAMRRVLEQISAINPDLVDGWRLQREELDKFNTKLQESINKANKWHAFWIGLRSGVGMSMQVQGMPGWELMLPDVPPRVWDDRSDILKEKALQHPAQKWAGPPKPPDDGKGSGGSEMSPALAAALEDLQDLQALEKTPDTLRRTLETVRALLATHQAELTKLGKNRDLERLRDITLPKEILQADYQAALQKLNAQEQLKEITPAQVKEGLQAIQEKFAAYLEQNPDQALQLQLRIKGASEDELRAPLEAWQKAFRQTEAMGLWNGREQLKLASLRTGLSLASSAGDMDAVAQLLGEIKQVEAAMQQANFEGKFDRIAQAREKAFAGAAGQLAELEKALIDEEAKGDKADPEQVKQIKQQMLDAVRPALEAQRDALQELLKDTKLTDEQRLQAEQELASVKAELYDQDVAAHRIATEAKTAAERAATDAKEEAVRNQQKWLQELERADLERIRNRQEADERAQREHIQGLQDELSALERLWAAEDRRTQRADLREELAAVMADTSFLKIGPDGKPYYTYDEERVRELERQIRDADREEERAQQREDLQDQIRAAQDELGIMQERHRTELDERQNFWTWIQGLDLSAYADLTTAAEQGLEMWAKVFETKLSGLKTKAQTEADEIKRILDSISGGIASTGDGLSIETPTLPASLPASVGGSSTVVATVPQTIIVNGATDPQATAKAVKGAAQEGARSGIDEAARSGREALRGKFKMF
jgi:hypothetical protein